MNGSRIVIRGYNERLNNLLSLGVTHKRRLSLVIGSVAAKLHTVESRNDTQGSSYFNTMLGQQLKCALLLQRVFAFITVSCVAGVYSGALSIVVCKYCC